MTEEASIRIFKRLERILETIDDVNPIEIADHVRSDSVKAWTKSLRDYVYERVGEIKDEVRKERTCHAIRFDNLNESNGMGDAWEECSECGALLAVITDNQPTPNYCPVCGAKVVED